MSHSKSGPLQGKRIIELAGLGPAPHCGQLLADMGAEVILIDRPNAIRLPIENRGKKSIIVDLRSPGSAEVILKLIESADALIEGLRPGVTERLGIGPEECHARNPKLVYGRMTGWGQDGPMASMAGHDINYLSITGALHALGTADQVPPPPLNMVGDYGGGSLFLALGVVSALLKASETGKGDVIDAAIVDGVSSLFGMVRSLDVAGQWSPNRSSNMLDGGAPYYRCYRTKDNKFMAVGCIEPQFFAIMIERLEIDLSEYGKQNDPRLWQKQTAILENIFSSQDRHHWASLFDNSDACITPVLDYKEALENEHNVARHSFIEKHTVSHPNRAPRFNSNPQEPDLSFAKTGQQTEQILAQSGFSNEEIDALINTKIVIAAD